MKVAVVGTGFGRAGRRAGLRRDRRLRGRRRRVASARDDAADRRAGGAPRRRSRERALAAVPARAARARRARRGQGGAVRQAVRGRGRGLAGEARGVALCNFEFRFCAGRRLRLRELVRTGALGAIEHVQSSTARRARASRCGPTGWLFDRERGGGWIGAWGSHAVDRLRFLFGARSQSSTRGPASTSANGPTTAGVMHACTAEDGLTATLRLSTGVTVAIDSTFAAAANLAPRLTVFGRKRWLRDPGRRDRRRTHRRAPGEQRDTIEIGDGGGRPPPRADAPLRGGRARRRDERRGSARRADVRRRPRLRPRARSAAHARRLAAVGGADRSSARSNIRGQPSAVRPSVSSCWSASSRAAAAASSASSAVQRARPGRRRRRSRARARGVGRGRDRVRGVDAAAGAVAVAGLRGDEALGPQRRACGRRTCRRCGPADRR